MAREITARWTDRATDLDFTAAWHDVRRVVLEAFSDSHSPSVQFTPASMGDAVLQARPEIERIRFSLPHEHHLLDDLSRSGLENDHEIFHHRRAVRADRGHGRAAPAPARADDNGAAV